MRISEIHWDDMLTSKENPIEGALSQLGAYATEPMMYLVSELSEEIAGGKFGDFNKATIFCNELVSKIEDLGDCFQRLEAEFPAFMEQLKKAPEADMPGSTPEAQ